MTTTLVNAQDKVLRAGYRQCPPEMIVDSKTGQGSGLLIEILDEAAEKIGYNVQWRDAPFQRSYHEL